MLLLSGIVVIYDNKSSCEDTNIWALLHGKRRKVVFGKSCPQGKIIDIVHHLACVFSNQRIWIKFNYDLEKWWIQLKGIEHLGLMTFQSLNAENNFSW